MKMMKTNQDNIKEIRITNNTPGKEKIQFTIDGETFERRLYVKEGKMEFRLNNEMIRVMEVREEREEEMTEEKMNELFKENPALELAFEKFAIKNRLFNTSDYSPIESKWRVNNIAEIFEAFYETGNSVVITSNAMYRNLTAYEWETVQAEADMMQEKERKEREAIRSDLKPSELKDIEILSKSLRQRGMSLYQAEISFYTSDSDSLMASLSFREKLGEYTNQLWWEDEYGIEHQFDASRFEGSDTLERVMININEMIRYLFIEVPTLKERGVA